MTMENSDDLEWKLGVVVVTYNRSKLLHKTLKGLLLNPKNNLDKIYVIDNASSDDTEKVVEKFSEEDNRVIYIKMSKNLGGAGGFSEGVKRAYQDGADWIGLMDDDVVLDRTCLDVLKRYSKKVRCMAAVREDLEGNLAEYAALKYNLKNPFLINPKTKSFNTVFKKRSECPEVVELACASFEGFFIHRNVVEKVGYPAAEYFIYGDDFDYSLRVRAQSIKIYAIRDAVVVRQLPYVKSKFDSWKTYYIWRNFFILHLIYGENFLVRLKPYIMYCGFKILTLIKKKSESCQNVLSDAIKIAKKIKERTAKHH